MIPWPQVLWSLMAEPIAEWWNAVRRGSGRVPKQCAGCLQRRPKERIEWELWEARHATCAPIGMQVPW